MRWPDEGSLLLKATNLSTTLLEPFVLAKMEPIELPDFNFNGGWSNGPAHFALTATVAYHQLTNHTEKLRQLGPLESAIARANISGDARGLTVSNVTVSVDSANVFAASGYLPVTFNPASTNLVSWQGGLK